MSSTIMRVMRIMELAMTLAFVHTRRNKSDAVKTNRLRLDGGFRKSPCSVEPDRPRHILAKAYPAF
jgi:hypothetical protein